MRRSLGPLLCIPLLLAAPAGATAHPLITQASSGKSFRLAHGATATLRLGGRWTWAQPRLGSKSIELTPIEFFVDPGYSEWVVTARRRGTATIRAAGTPKCTGCTQGRSFIATIVVT